MNEYASVETSLETLKEEVLNCHKCDLARTRNHVIFGEGNIRAPIFIIGEAPGRDEDLIGRPFVGRSGQLLDKILAACGFNREEHVYISNIIKCRPPGNREPSREERKACLPYLIRQVDLINPPMVIFLGSTALKSLAGGDKKITRLRGNWMEWEHHLAMPVYHPSALLRNPALKRDTWEDFKKIVYKYRELIDPSHHSDHV
ncbi:MAG: uracil-DNA glycosylase [Bacteroidales bacterium]